MLLNASANTINPDCNAAGSVIGSSSERTSGPPHSPGSASSISAVNRLSAPRHIRHGSGQSINVSTHAAPPCE